MKNCNDLCGEGEEAQFDIKKPNWNSDRSWGRTLFLSIYPFVVLPMAIFSVYRWGFSFIDFIIFFVMFIFTGLSITAGYHRYFSHRTYDCHPIVKGFYLLFGAAAFESSVIGWCSDHRYHHRFVDKPSDPYNINQGFFYAHMGWMFRSEPKGRSFENVPDLTADRWVAWQEKYYWAIFFTVGLVFPMSIGIFFERAIPALIFGGFVRILCVHHATWLINSAAHYFGSRPYSGAVTARDAWFLSFFTFGEGYHNFHHVFASDYRNGVQWYAWDPTKWLIWVLEKTGLAFHLKRVPGPTIFQVKIKRQFEISQEKIANLSLNFDSRFHWMSESLSEMKTRVESASREWRELRKKYESWKSEFNDQMILNQKQWKLERQRWKANIRQSRAEFYREWKRFQMMNRFVRNYA